ncbi:MAG: EamA family transporter [Candidatus Caldarchaeum sp.]
MLETYVGVSAALGAALLFSLSRIFVRLGLSHGYVNQAHYTSVVLNNLFLWPLAIFYTFSTQQIPSLFSVIVFLLAGLFATGLGRLLAFTTLKTMTVTESTPFISLSPLFASAIGVLFMGETPSIKIVVGTVFVVAGLLMVSKLREYIIRASILIGLTASFFYSLGEVLRKYGMTITPNPPLGAATGALAALALLLFYKNNTTIYITKNKFFFLSGFTTSAALILVFVSYTYTALTIAVPLINTSPLFTILLSLLITRHTENLSPQLIAGTLTVMAGILLIVS